jgi:phospholipid/cholesterol/gamma-HCH transport system ATP-binding protein
MTPAVRLEHVTKRFDGRRVLDDVSFDVQEGSGFAILGRSGTGKSVTLKHIIGLIEPDEGAVYVEGRALAALSRRELSVQRRRMGFLFQNAALFHSITVGENVAFPLRRHTDWPDGRIRERVRTKLAQVGLEADFDKMPGDLSGGMRKRAGLARAMALDPPILLVDEPSAGLDPMTSEEIDDLLASLKQKSGTTLILVTHNIPSAKRLADELAIIHEGRILERGTAAELAASRDELVGRFMRAGATG